MGPPASSSGSQNCQGVTIAPNGTCQITYNFTPTAIGPVTGSTNGSVNGVAFSFSFSGTGTGIPKVSISPSTFAFGDVPVGATSTLSATVTNISGAPLPMTMTGGGGGQFGGSQDCVGVTLAPNASCHITYHFTPAAFGPATGTATGNVSGLLFAFTFSGNGVPGVSIDPNPHAFAFGDVALGIPSLAQSATVTNISTSPLLMSMTGGGAGEFGGSQDCVGTTLAPGGTCHIEYQFTPATLGAQTTSTNGDVNGGRLRIHVLRQGHRPGRVPAGHVQLLRVRTVHASAGGIVRGCLRRDQRDTLRPGVVLGSRGRESLH